MDTNNNNSKTNAKKDSELKMEVGKDEVQDPQNTSTASTHEDDEQHNETSNENEDQDPDRIELYVRYDASDMLRDESGTQTPIEDEQGASDGNATSTNANPNNDSQNKDRNITDLNTNDTTMSTNDEFPKSNSKTKVIRVLESEDDSSESIEIELEDDNSLLLTSLTSLFPEATGLKFRHPETNTLRGVKLVDGKFTEPLDGWSSVKNYICVFNRGSKRKIDDDNDSGKRARTDDGGSDLVVLGLPWTTTEETMKNYFEQYGEVVMVQVKTDPKSGKSRGFGFVRFAKSSIQNKLLSMRHFIDGRWCDVRVPLSKAEADASKAANISRKIFVGRLPDNITTDDLRNHFSEYGTLTDVFIPKPFRNFAFVTFGTPDMAQSIFKHKHVINGTPVQISEAIPRDNGSSNSYGSGGGSGASGVSMGYSSAGGVGPQANQAYAAASVGGSYMGATAANNIHPFNNNYGTHQASHHHYGGKNNASGNFGGANAYQNNRKMHPQSTYYQMPSYGSSGPSSAVDSASYVNHSDYSSFAAAGYSQASSGVNGGQYYKMQQQQPVMTSNQNHSTYSNQPSYSNHGANFSRGSYGSVWK